MRIRLTQIIGGIICFLGWALVIAGAVIQIVLQVQKYGALFEGVIIWHWSLAFLLGVIPACVGFFMMNK